VGAEGEQRYKQRQSAVAHVIVLHMHDPVLSSLKMKAIRLLFFLVCLFLFSTCFGQICAHQQEK
jgi:hypothetical protein